MRVLIADDHALFRDGLRSLLEAHGVSVVAEARNGREAVELARIHHPDVVLMDLTMPELGGLAATRLLTPSCRSRGGGAHRVRGRCRSLRGGEIGAQGFPEDLEATGFSSCWKGSPGASRRSRRVWRARSSARSLAPSPVRATTRRRLTTREREVLELLVQGITSNRELAERLFVSENTIKYHLRHILDKLHLQNRAPGDRLRPPPRLGGAIGLGSLLNPPVKSHREVMSRAHPFGWGGTT